MLIMPQPAHTKRIVGVVITICGLYFLMFVVPATQAMILRSRCGPIPQGRHSAINLASNENRIIFDCVPSYKYSSGDKEIVCLASNQSWSGTPLACKDAVNCEGPEAPCKNGGKCLESDPSFTCMCKQHYKGGLCEEANGGWGEWKAWNNCTATCNSGIKIRRRACDNPKPTIKGKMCKGNSMQVQDCYPADCPEKLYKWCGEDYDRCGQLSKKAFCSIVDGSYRCTCLEGVQEVYDKTGSFVQCADVDECSNRLHTCDLVSSNCINTHGSYKCECKPGFVSYKDYCRDVNECKTAANNCDKNAICENNSGSYSCRCKRGYRSLTAKKTGFVGECVELRLILYGEEAEDRLVQNISSTTEEYVSPIIDFPTGIPLDDQAGFWQTCKSVYATENGVLVITNLTSAADHSWKATYRHPPPLQNGEDQAKFFMPSGRHECALLAPLWTDTKLDISSKLWYHMYDMEQQAIVDKSIRRGVYNISQEIKKLIPSHSRPKYVLVVTWERMIPPWPSRSEEVTFQAVFSTDGISTYVAFIYQARMMTWRPVYELPKDIPNYPAISGIFVKGGQSVVVIHSSSGEWTETTGNGDNETVYRLDQILFERTNAIGRNNFTLAAGITTVPKGICYDWYRNQPPLSSETLLKINSCPPYQKLISEQVNVTWFKDEISDDSNEVKCYNWKYTFEMGGTFECCYKAISGIAPLVSGLNAYNMGAGFYFVDKTSDEQMKRICCSQTKSNYFCSLYAQRRPPSTFINYTAPFIGSGSSGARLINLEGSEMHVSGQGEVSLLRAQTEEDLTEIDVIARFDQKVDRTITDISAIALRTENATVEFYSRPENEIECLLNGLPCFSVSNSRVFVKKLPEAILLSVRKGIFMNVSKTSESSLSFKIYVEPALLKFYPNVNGLLSRSKKCVPLRQTSLARSETGTSCDLGTIATFYNRDISEESFFSDSFGSLDTTTSQLSSNNINVTEITEKGSNDAGNREQTRAEQALFPLFINNLTALAEEDKPNSFSVNLDVSHITGSATLIGKEKSAITEPGKMSFTKDGSSLDQIELLVQDPQGTSWLSYPNTVVCRCSKTGGRCVASNPATLEGPFVDEAACQCKTGYIGERCEQLTAPCSENACFIGVDCKEVAAKRTGRVAERYACGDCPVTLEEGNGETCYHDNPCLRRSGEEGAHRCENADCRNQPQGYTCHCHQGYTKRDDDQFVCKDIDECSEDNKCDNEVGICINLPGSFECSCKSGYLPLFQNGRMECVDNNECLQNNGGCQRRCENTEGSFRCVCDVGYKPLRDGKSCEEVNECDVYAEQFCDQICDDNRIGKPFRCLCHDRYKLAEDYSTCLPLFSTSEETTTQTTTTDLTTRLTTQTTTNVLTTSRTSTTPLTTTTELMTSKMRTTTTTATLQSTTQRQRELENLISKLLTDSDLLKLFLMILQMPSTATDDQRCSALYLVLLNEEINISHAKLLLDNAKRLLLATYNQKRLDITIKMSRFFSDIQLASLPPSKYFLSIGDILSYLNLLRDCMKLWEEQAQVERRDTTATDTTAEATTQGSRSRPAILPWLLAWILIVTFCVVIIVFLGLILAVKFCFTARKGNLSEKRRIARQKKLEKRKQWPKIVAQDYM